MDDVQKLFKKNSTNILWMPKLLTYYEQLKCEWKIIKVIYKESQRQNITLSYFCFQICPFKTCLSIKNAMIYTKKIYPKYLYDYLINNKNKIIYQWDINNIFVLYIRIRNCIISRTWEWREHII